MFRLLAERVRLAGAGQRFVEEIAIGSEDLSGEAGDGEHHARLRENVLVLPGSEDFLVGIVGVEGGFVAGLAERAVVDKGADGNAVDELWDATRVIDVIVSEQNEVDAGEAGLFGGGDDTVGVAAVVAGPAGVDEEGVVVGCDKERGLAALDVDDENPEVAGSLSAEKCAGNDKEGEDSEQTLRKLHSGLRGEDIFRPRHDRGAQHDFASGQEHQRMVKASAAVMMPATPKPRPMYQ
jgi:hypothetical protein